MFGPSVQVFKLEARLSGLTGRAEVALPVTAMVSPLKVAGSSWVSEICGRRFDELGIESR